MASTEAKLRRLLDRFSEGECPRCSKADFEVLNERVGNVLNLESPNGADTRSGYILIALRAGDEAKLAVDAWLAKNPAGQVPAKLVTRNKPRDAGDERESFLTGRRVLSLLTKGGRMVEAGQAWELTHKVDGVKRVDTVSREVVRSLLARKLLFTERVAMLVKVELPTYADHYSPSDYAEFLRVWSDAVGRMTESVSDQWRARRDAQVSIACAALQRFYLALRAEKLLERQEPGLHNRRWVRAWNAFVTGRVRAVPESDLQELFVYIAEQNAPSLVLSYEDMVTNMDARLIPEGKR
jgi:hypothetical protein